MERVYAFRMRVFLLLCFAGVVAGQEARTPVHYQGRRIATTMSYHGADWLLRKEREREERTSELLKVLDVKPGQVACDLGCGNGYHALPLAEMVGDKGKVLCVDIQPEMLALLKRRAKKANLLGRIEPILATATDPRLPPRSVDLVLMVDVYHEISHPARVLGHVREALKPGGRVVFVEFRKEDLDVPIKSEHKMSKKQVVREAKANGLKLVRSHDDLPWQHVLFFERADGEDHPKGAEGWSDVGGGEVRLDGLTVASSARLARGSVDGASDFIVRGVAPKKKTPGPLTLSVTLTGKRVASLPLRFMARARGLPRDRPAWVSSPMVTVGKGLAHGGTDRGAALEGSSRSDATWAWPFMRTETSGPGVVLMLERTTSSEEIQIIQERDRLVILGVQRRWSPGQAFAFRFAVAPVEAATDALAIERYEAWSHEVVK